MSSAEPSGEDTDMIPETAATERSPQVTSSKRPVPEEAILGPNQRPISVYAAPSTDVPMAALKPHNEDDYEPTVAHAKLHQSRLLNNSQNKRLLSDKEAEEAEREKAARKASMTDVQIKVRFPDQTAIVAKFTADETAAQLYEHVSGVIAAKDQPFKLVWTNRGPHTVPKDEKNSQKKLIKDLGLERSVVVNLVWEDGASESARKGPTLKPEYATKAQEVAIPEVAEVEAKEENVTSTVDKGKEKENSEGGGGKKGMPKWFKGLGKK
jgi:tether containing UBX domain for GLUT4